MASFRHLSRIVAMQALFMYEFQGSDLSKAVQYAMKEFGGKADSAFVNQLLSGVLGQNEKLREIISKKAPEWPIEKIAPVDRAILEIGAFEILFSSDVPAVVAINEAVEIAKEYGGENSPKFINGVLSNIMNEKL